VIVMDRPRRLDDGRLTAHMLSDLDGDDGYRELLAVGVSIGCLPVFLQYRGTYKEHFDLMGPRRVAAAAAHPLIREVTRREVALILQRKKAAVPIRAGS